MRQQPFPHAGVEILNAFPVERVSGLIIQIKRTVWNGTSYFFAHPNGRENILSPANNQAGLADATQFFQSIVLDAGFGLSLQPVQGLGHGVNSRLFPAFL